MKNVRDPGPCRIISDPAFEWGSNFFPCAIPHRFQYNGETAAVVFRSSEHFFMWHKNDTLEFRTAILKAKTPAEAKHIGSKIGMAKLGFTLNPMWDVIDPVAGVAFKVKVMRYVLTRKFVMNPGLAELLVRTGRRKITENAPWDSYWGTGKDGNGEDWQGRTLMWVRDRLQNAEIHPYRFNVVDIIHDMRNKGYDYEHHVERQTS